MAYSKAFARLATAGLVSAMLAAAGGCTGNWATDTSRQAVTAPASPGPLNVRTHNGYVEVRRADVAEIQIDATIRAVSQERADQTRVIAEAAPEGGTRVYVVWPEGRRQGNEGCSLVIRVPSADGVDIDTSNGRVITSGLRGQSRIDTSNGAIEIEDHDGKVVADTSNGRITMKRVVGDIVADTSNGAIEVLDVAGRVKADTSNGRVLVRLAPGCQAPMNLDTSNGAVRVEVAADYAGVFEASTSNGGVSVQGANSVNGGRQTATATFGSGGERSIIRTSNGRVEVVSVAVER